MKIAIQYVNDSSGKTHAVQLQLSDWEKVLDKLKMYEESLKLKSDLKEAFEQVKKMRNSKLKKQSLNEFLDEL
jgi:asparagine synthetase A